LVTERGVHQSKINTSAEAAGSDAHRPRPEGKAMTATENQVKAAATAQLIGAGLASLKPFPKWEEPGEKPRELETGSGTWPANTDTPLYSGQGDDRRESRF
jgi:hypothetical protein